MTKHSRKPSKSQLTLDKAPQVHSYTTPDLELVVTVNNEDIWLSQKQMSDLFGVHPMTINEHIKNVIATEAPDNSVIKKSFLTAADGKQREVEQDSTIRKFLIVAADGKQREVLHYGLDIIIPVGYRVGSPQAAEFRKWANNVLKQYLLVGYAINQRRMGSKSLLKMEDDLTQLERHNLTSRPEYQRLSRVYENKHGEELLFAMIKDVCLNPDYRAIKGLEYKVLFGMWANDLKAVLGTDKIRENLPDIQLQAFTLAELSLRKILETQKNMSNEQLLEAVRIAFAPIGVYLRGISELMGVHVVTGQPLLASGK